MPIKIYECKCGEFTLNKGLCSPCQYIKDEEKNKVSDFWFKKLGKMISDEDYELNERFATKLLDLGFINITKMGYTIGKALYHSSYYIVTESGKEAYNKWKEGK